MDPGCSGTAVPLVPSGSGVVTGPVMLDGDPEHPMRSLEVEE